MSDKELLELAAKAAGYDAVWDRAMGCFLHRNPPRFNRITRNIWIPLEDDGDALRLAVKLRMMVEFDHIRVDDPCVYVHYFAEGQRAQMLTEPLGSDECITTRRAIVRAAAELAKVMP